MTWIDLGNPSPRVDFSVWQPVEWDAHIVELLAVPFDLNLPRFHEVVTSRRSQRSFGTLTSNQLAYFLWLTCRITTSGTDCLGFPITQRPTPSAGAIHPIHILIENERSVWSRYVPESHGLAQIDQASSLLRDLCRKVREVLDPQLGTTLLFVAEPGKTASKYDYAASLVWRDAGILIGHMALVAESLRLNFCPLGITGEPWASELNEQGKLVGVGVALLGSKPVF